MTRHSVDKMLKYPIHVLGRHLWVQISCIKKFLRHLFPGILLIILIFWYLLLHLEDVKVCHTCTRVAFIGP